MMLEGMRTGMILCSLLVTCLLLGFAFILWVVAKKETPLLKWTGQIIAIIIAVIAVVMFLYGSTCGLGKGMCPMMKKPMLMHKMMKVAPKAPAAVQSTVATPETAKKKVETKSTKRAK